VSLSQEQLLAVVANTPLVSIDLVMRNTEGGILVGQRRNEPAKGSWFVPGGCIRKGETLPVAFKRISKDELGDAQELNDARLMGAYTHLYDTNFAGIDGIRTHYVVLAYKLETSIDLLLLPRTQHSSWKRVSTKAQDSVHPNVVPYFQPSE